jgi:hypothetical protein
MQTARARERNRYGRRSSGPSEAGRDRGQATRPAVLNPFGRIAADRPILASARSRTSTIDGGQDAPARRLRAARGWLVFPLRGGTAMTTIETAATTIEAKARSCAAAMGSDSTRVPRTAGSARSASGPDSAPSTHTCSEQRSSWPPSTQVSRSAMSRSPLATPTHAPPRSTTGDARTSTATPRTSWSPSSPVADGPAAKHGRREHADRQHDAPHGTAPLPSDLTDDQLAAAPVLASVDALLIEELSKHEDEAFAAALES